MRERSPFWELVGTGCLVLCVSCYAAACYYTGDNVCYMRIQVVVWAAAEVMYRTRWRKDGRGPWEGFITGLGWPAVALGAYWFVRKEEYSRKMRIIREVMES